MQISKSQDFSLLDLIRADIIVLEEKVLQFREIYIHCQWCYKT